MIIICLIILTHYKSLASSTLKNTIFNHSSGFANVCTTSSAASHARIPRREKFILCEDRQRNVDHLVIQMITLINILHKDIIGPGGLRPPCVLACPMRSLAIVTTIVLSFSLSSSSSFSPSFAFDPLRGNSHVRNNFSPNILA